MTTLATRNKIASLLVEPSATWSGNTQESNLANAGQLDGLRRFRETRGQLFRQIRDFVDQHLQGPTTSSNNDSESTLVDESGSIELLEIIYGNRRCSFQTKSEVMQTALEPGPAFAWLRNDRCWVLRPSHEEMSIQALALRIDHARQAKGLNRSWIVQRLSVWQGTSDQVSSHVVRYIDSMLRVRSSFRLLGTPFRRLIDIHSIQRTLALKQTNL